MAQASSTEPLKIDGSAAHLQMYDRDFIQWVDHAAELLKQGRFDELDLENLIDEVECLGRSEKHALTSNLRILLMHLLKWQYQIEKRTGSWRGTVAEHRTRIQEAFEHSPSLKTYYVQVFDKSYGKARILAASETGLDLKLFPVECLYSVDQVLDDEFWPGT
ncbi:MAG: DUF29 domain-containing protein [Thermosynechococcaceae cyanobacterium]